MKIFCAFGCGKWFEGGVICPNCGSGNDDIISVLTLEGDPREFAIRRRPFPGEEYDSYWHGSSHIDEEWEPEESPPLGVQIIKVHEYIFGDFDSFTYYSWDENFPGVIVMYSL
ncbi:MAG: hypothetical protein GX765_04650 [Candidatus Moranbacteria bacterium]|nr:hypothetical protein [Candidatus Moranbacteria bacterium]NLC31310.1 hypothetical protein [Candidatus Moranbacteria bacterium]